MANAYFDKIITTDSPKPHNLVKTCILYKFYHLYLQLLSIMLALCLMLLLSYYAQNYAGIIGPTLLSRKLHAYYNNIITILVTAYCYTTPTKNACELCCMISSISVDSHSKLQNKQMWTLSQTHFQYGMCTPSFFQHYLTRDLQKARPVKVQIHNLEVN